LYLLSSGTYSQQIKALTASFSVKREDEKKKPFLSQHELLPVHIIHLYLSFGSSKRPNKPTKIKREKRKNNNVLISTKKI
jgi:hypothetical protein